MVSLIPQFFLYIYHREQIVNQPRMYNPKFSKINSGVSKTALYKHSPWLIQSTSQKSRNHVKNYSHTKSSSTRIGHPSSTESVADCTQSPIPQVPLKWYSNMLRHIYSTIKHKSIFSPYKKAQSCTEEYFVNQNMKYCSEGNDHSYSSFLCIKKPTAKKRQREITVLLTTTSPQNTIKAHHSTTHLNPQSSNPSWSGRKIYHSLLMALQTVLCNELQHIVQHNAGWCITRVTNNSNGAQTFPVD